MAALLAGCQGASPLVVRDGDALLPNLRVQVRPEGRDRRGPGGNGTVFEATHGSGRFGGGEGAYALTGLQSLVQIGTDPDCPVSARLLGGLEFVDLRVLPPPGGPAATHGSALGPLLGLDVCWRVAAGIAVYGRGTAAAMLPDTSTVRIETGLIAWPAAGLEFTLGVRRWGVRRENWFDAVIGSDREFDLRIDGIVLGCGFVF